MLVATLQFSFGWAALRRGHLNRDLKVSKMTRAMPEPFIYVQKAPKDAGALSLILNYECHFPQINSLGICLADSILILCCDIRVIL